MCCSLGGALYVCQTINETTDYKTMCIVLQKQLDELLDRQRQQNRYTAVPPPVHCRHQTPVDLTTPRCSVMVARYEELKQQNADLRVRADDAEARCEKALEDAEEAQLQAAMQRKQAAALTARLEVQSESQRARLCSRASLTGVGSHPACPNVSVCSRQSGWWRRPKSLPVLSAPAARPCWKKLCLSRWLSASASRTRYDDLRTCWRCDVAAGWLTPSCSVETCHRWQCWRQGFRPGARKRRAEVGSGSIV